ncbi:MAG: hypothetical protein ACI35S_05295 [Anaeroplasma sp.]
MKRENVRSLLVESGIENPSNLLISAILDAAKTDRETAVAEAVAATKKEYEGYVSSADHKKVTDELATLKNSQAKSNRLAKLKDLGIADKYLDHADSIIGTDENGYDDRVKKYKEDYPELLVNTTKDISFSGSSNNAVGSSNNTGNDSQFNKDLRAALGIS